MESEKDGFERFQYKDQTQVTGYTKTGETIRVTMENITTGNSFIVKLRALSQLLVKTLARENICLIHPPPPPGNFFGLITA